MTRAAARGVVAVVGLCAMIGGAACGRYGPPVRQDPSAAVIDRDAPAGGGTSPTESQREAARGTADGTEPPESDR